MGLENLPVALSGWWGLDARNPGAGVLQSIAGLWVNDGGRTWLFDDYSWAHVCSVVIDDT